MVSSKGRGLGHQRPGGSPYELRPQCAGQPLKWATGGSLALRGGLFGPGWAEWEDSLWGCSGPVRGGEQAPLSLGFPAELHTERSLHRDLASATEHHT